MRIVLCGYRGSGKTTVGGQVADRLGWAFSDVDDEIRQRFDGRSIAEIWAEFGEPRFREVEVEVVRELCQRERIVIALGGGSLMQDGAREAVIAAKDTLRVYLEADPAVLHARIADDANTRGQRPNLTALGGGEDEIRAVLAKREPFYRATADVVTPAADLDATANAIVDHAMQALGLEPT